MRWLRSHTLLIGCLLFGLIAYALFTWAEYGYFCDQASSHKEPCAGFWSMEHVHDWLYNSASNWQSDLLIGLFLGVLLSRWERRLGGEGEQ